MTTNPDTFDAGPAPEPPAWCVPGTTGRWEQLTDGGGACLWARYFGPDEMSADVWIECQDSVAFGRLLRTRPRIGYTEPSRDGVDAAGARRLAAELLNAADVLDPPRR